MTNLVLVTTEDNEYRKIMTAYTPQHGVLQILTDNQHCSVIVEYDKHGTMIKMEMDLDPEVKEI